MSETEHQLQKLNFNIKFYSEKESFRFKLDFENTLENRLLPVIEEAFKQQDIEKYIIKINKIEIDLGSIPYNEFEREVPRLFKNKLREALSGTLAKVSQIPSDEVEVIPTELSDLDNLLFFLENGSFPWWSQSNISASIVVSVLFQKVLDKQQPLLISRLSTLLKKKKIQLRMVRQLPSEVLLRFLKILGGDKVDKLWEDLEIIARISETTNRVFKKELLKIYMLQLWFYNKNYTVSSETLIDHLISFVSSETTQSYSQLIIYLKSDFQLAKKQLNYQFQSGLKELEKVEVTIPNEESNNSINDVLDYIESYLRETNASGNINEFENNWNLLVLNYPEELLSIYRRTWPIAAVKKKTIQFPDKKIIQLIKIIEPSNSEYIISYAEDVQTAEKKNKVTGASEKDFRDSTWRFILEYLLVERGSVFNKKSFLKSFLMKTSASLGIKLSELIFSLLDAAETLELNLSLKQELPKFLQEFQKEIYESKKQRKRPEAYFEETFRHYQINDILQFFLLHGALPVTADGSPPDFNGLELTLWRYLESNQSQLESILENLLARRKYEVTKRIQEQFSPELSKEIQSTFQHLFEQTVAEEETEEDVTEIEEFTHELIYFLEQGKLLSTTYRSSSEFLKVFAELYPDELDMLIQRFSKETYQKVLSLIPEEQRKNFKRKSYGLSAKERWNQTSEILKTALIDWLKSGKRDTRFSLHLLEETARDYLEINPEKFNQFFELGISNKVVRNRWAKTLSESTLVRWLHTYRTSEFKTFMEQSRVLIETLRKSGFSKSSLLDYKTMQWEFLLDLQARQVGETDLYSLTRQFLRYIKEKFAVQEDFSELQFIEKLKAQNVTLAAQNALDKLKEELQQDLESNSRQRRENRRAGRAIQRQRMQSLKDEIRQLKQEFAAKNELIRSKSEITQQIELFEKQGDQLKAILAEIIQNYDIGEAKESIQNLAANLFEDPLFAHLFPIVQRALFKKGQDLSEEISGLFSEYLELTELIETSGFVGQQFVQQLVAEILPDVEEISKENVELVLADKYESISQKEVFKYAVFAKVIREFTIASFVKLKQTYPPITQLTEMLVSQGFSLLAITKEVPIFFSEIAKEQVLELLPKNADKNIDSWRKVGFEKIDVKGQPLSTYLENVLKKMVARVMSTEDSIADFLGEFREIETAKSLPIDLELLKKVEVELPNQKQELESQIDVIDSVEETIKQLETEITEKEKELEVLEKREEEAPQDETESPKKSEPIYVNNAGIVILHPYIKVLFQRLKLTENNSFINVEAAHKAVYVLQYIANLTEGAPEHELALNKFLCGIDFSEPIETEIELTESDKNTCEEMLNAVISQWTALKNTTPDGLRISFFQREGRLSNEIDGWYLRVSSRAYDVLLDRLPWSYSLFKLPWMSNFLKVEWR